MSKKIMILSGSPRKNGNTNTVVGWFIEGAREAGAEVELIDAASLKANLTAVSHALAVRSQTNLNVRLTMKSSRFWHGYRKRMCLSLPRLYISSGQTLS